MSGAEWWWSFSFAHSRRGATMQDSAWGNRGQEGTFAPSRGPGPSLTSQPLSRVAIVSPEKALFSEVLPAKCMSSTFPLLETFLPASLQPQPWVSPCPGPRWRELTQAEWAPMPGMHTPSGGPCGECVTPLICLQRAPGWFHQRNIPRLSATFCVSCAISKLEGRGSVSQILSLWAGWSSTNPSVWECFHPAQEVSSPSSPGKAGEPWSRFWCGKPWLWGSSTCLRRKHHPLIWKGQPLVPQEPVSVSAGPAPGSGTSDHKAVLSHSSSFKKKKIFFFNWDIIILQCCVGFCHTSTWTRCRFTYVLSLEGPSHLPVHPRPLGSHRAPSWAPCTKSNFSLALHMVMCMVHCYSVNPSRPLLASLCTGLFSTSKSILALQIGSQFF